MIKPQKAVIDNTVYIASFTTILSLIMQAGFFFLKKWDYTVLTGNLLGACAAVLNFYVLALFVQSAVSKDEKDAKNTLKLSQSVRYLALIIVAVIGICVPVFNGIATVLPFLFAQFAVTLYPILYKNKEGEN